MSWVKKSNEERQIPGCPACGSQEANFLGRLGNREHFRCVNCGMEYSHEVFSKDNQQESPPTDSSSRPTIHLVKVGVDKWRAESELDSQALKGLHLPAVSIDGVSRIGIEGLVNGEGYEVVWHGVDK